MESSLQLASRANVLIQHLTLYSLNNLEDAAPLRLPQYLPLIGSSQHQANSCMVDVMAQ